MDWLVMLLVAGEAGLGLAVGGVAVDFDLIKILRMKQSKCGTFDSAAPALASADCVEVVVGRERGSLSSDVSMLAILAARRAISAGGSCSRKTEARNSRMCLWEKSSQDWADMLPK